MCVAVSLTDSTIVPSFDWAAIETAKNASDSVRVRKVLGNFITNSRRKKMFQDSVNATGITQLYTDCCIFLVLWNREVALRMLSPQARIEVSIHNSVDLC